MKSKKTTCFFEEESVSNVSNKKKLYLNNISNNSLLRLLSPAPRSPIGPEGKKGKKISPLFYYNLNHNKNLRLFLDTNREQAIERKNMLKNKEEEERI